MATRTQPEVVTHICDACGLEQGRSFDCQMTLKITGRDFQGKAVGANNVSRDLCDKCVNKINKLFMNLDEKKKMGK